MGCVGHTPFHRFVKVLSLAREQHWFLNSLILKFEIVCCFLLTHTATFATIRNARICAHVFGELY